MAVSSWCRAVGWRLSCYGRQVFSTRVGSHMDALLTNSSQIFFCLESVLVQIFSRLRSNPYWPGLWHLRASPAITGFVPSQTQTLCSYNCRAACLTALAQKLVPSHKQESQTLCSYVARRAVLSHIQTNIKILGVKI